MMFTPSQPLQIYHGKKQNETSQNVHYFYSAKNKPKLTVLLKPRLCKSNSRHITLPLSTPTTFKQQPFIPSRLEPEKMIQLLTVHSTSSSKASLPTGTLKNDSIVYNAFSQFKQSFPICLRKKKSSEEHNASPHKAIIHFSKII